MRSNRYSEEQIIGILKEVSAGKSAREVIRHYGIAEATFYRWRERYAGVELAEARRMAQLEQENRRLKQMVAELSLDKEVLKSVIAKNGFRPEPRAARSQRRWNSSQSVSGARAGWSRSTAPARVTRPARWTTKRACAMRWKNSRSAIRATAIDGCGWNCAAAATRSIISGSIGCIGGRGLSCGAKPVGGSPIGGRRWRNSRGPISNGRWTLSTTASATGGRCGC